MCSFCVFSARHVELDGTPFPNARGCSFYRINDRGQICYARDIVESPIKAGDAALQAIGTLAPLVKRFGGSPPSVPWASVGLWGFYAGWSMRFVDHTLCALCLMHTRSQQPSRTGYVSLVMFSTIPPGLPATQTPPEIFQELFNMSLNFFYVNIALHAAGVPFVPSPGLLTVVC